MVLYFNWTIFTNKTKYYLPINRESFLQIRYGFYSHALRIRYLLWWLVIERASMNWRRLMAGTWLFGASWWKFVKALLLCEIVHVSFFFFHRRNWNSECPGKAVAKIGIWLAGVSTPTQSYVISNHYEISERFQGKSAS